MKKEIRTVVFHDRLRLESCRFTGIEQPFPNHFHDHYVIGYIEGGRRSLTCRNRTRVIQKGDLILFNPGDSHGCTQTGNDALTYRSLNVPRNVMQKLAEDVTGSHDLPGFSPNVITDEEAVYCLIPLHEMLMGGGCEPGWEEKLLFLLSILIQKYSRPFQQCIPACRDEIEKVCAYMEQNYAGHITLDQLCRCAGLSKSTLLRAFTKSKGVTPYSYLENIRIGRAKQLLEQGVSPVEAALQTGFSDQSHFTNYFTRFIGLPPGSYRRMFTVETEKGESSYAAQTPQSQTTPHR